MIILWDNLDKVGVILSLLISSIAIFISFRSCSDSNEALELSKKEYQSKRDLVLESISGHISPGFEIKPFDPNQKLQRVILLLPSSFAENEQVVGPPEFQIVLTEFQDSLRKILKPIARKYVKQNYLNIGNILVPAFLKSNYVVGGENLWDTSIYELEFDYHFNSINENESYLYFKNLMFIGKWLSEDDPINSVNKYWKRSFNQLKENLESLYVANY